MTGYGKTVTKTSVASACRRVLSFAFDIMFP